MPGGDVRITMKRHWKKLLGALVVVLLAVVGVSWWYAKFYNQADKEFDIAQAAGRVSTTSTTGAPAAGATTTDVPLAATTVVPTPTTAGPVGADGVWAIIDGSEVGYRVDESINGFATTANGRTKAVTGSMTAAGTTISDGQFTVDMTTFKSDESRRDGQFNGRIMDVANFPTATFVLTSPIDFGKIPADGETLTVPAAGDLTLHGTTRPVTFSVDAQFTKGKVVIVGKIPVVFADYGIPNPSIATIKTADNGLLEFLLVLDRK
jgi:polyisoprenoid-binding protein YceI